MRFFKRVLELLLRRSKDSAVIYNKYFKNDVVKIQKVQEKIFSREEKEVV